MKDLLDLVMEIYGDVSDIVGDIAKQKREELEKEFQPRYSSYNYILEDPAHRRFIKNLSK